MYVLEEMDKQYFDHRMQFGFKKHSPCQHAIFAFKSVADKYRKQNKMLLICALDFSKAFDKVNRTKLFIKLYEKLENKLHV